MNESKPLVSICCLTYNHENFIRSAIDGFLSQVTSFPFEIIIHDDASTDGTTKIVLEYASRFPELIHAVIQTVNQYSIGKLSLTKLINDHSRGKYVALCEGDDYWTNPNKLQKQVDFLETNPDYSICVSGYTRLIHSTLEKSNIIQTIKENDRGHNGFTFSLEEMQKKWITKTLTAVIRKTILAKIDFSMYRHVRDIHLFYHLCKKHRGFYFTEIFGVFRVHEGGINSMKQGRVNYNAAYNCYRELYEHNKDDFTRDMCRRHTLALLNYNLFNKYEGNTLSLKFNLFFEAVVLTRRLPEIKYLFTALIHSGLKDNLRSSLNFYY
jgi:glycosyltransferase involved in cell wall biosynthesis